MPSTPTSTTCGPSSVSPGAGSRPSAASATGSRTADETAELEASEADARLLRRVGWRLVAFSGGSTLVVLLVLGIALYLSVASSLESTAVASLDRRATAVQSFGQGPGGPRGPNSPIDLVFGGTFAILITPDGSAVGPRQIAIPGGLPDVGAASVANRSGRDVRTSTISVRSPGSDVERVDVRQ